MVSHLWNGPSPLQPTTRKSGWTLLTSWQIVSCASPLRIHASQAIYVNHIATKDMPFVKDANLKTNVHIWQLVFTHDYLKK